MRAISRAARLSSITKTIRISAAAQARCRLGSMFVGEVGFISQPAGGADDYDLTFGPIFYIAGGASFGG